MVNMNSNQVNVNILSYEQDFWEYCTFKFKWISESSRNGDFLNHHYPLSV